MSQWVAESLKWLSCKHKVSLVLKVEKFSKIGHQTIINHYCVELSMYRLLLLYLKVLIQLTVFVSVMMTRSLINLSLLLKIFLLKLMKMWVTKETVDLNVNENTGNASNLEPTRYNFDDALSVLLSSKCCLRKIPFKRKDNVQFVIGTTSTIDHGYVVVGWIWKVKKYKN